MYPPEPSYKNCLKGVLDNPKNAEMNFSFEEGDS